MVWISSNNLPFFFESFVWLGSVQLNHIWFICELWRVFQGFSYLCKPCCIVCTWMVSPQSASSCAAANYQKKCKHSCTGYIWTASLLCASSSRELLNHELECTNNCMLYFCVAFHQSASSCASSACLLLLFYIHTDCSCAFFPRRGSWYALWGL